MQFFEFESQPETQPKGDLDPPRRRPPTAIGTGSLPPRRPEDPSDAATAPQDDGAPYREPTAVRQIALRLLAFQVFLAAAALLRPLGWRAYLGVIVAGLAQFVWQRARARTLRELRALSGDETGESHLRSA